MAGLAELERVGTVKGGVSGSGWVFPDSGASFLSFPFCGSPLTVSRESLGLLGFHPHLVLFWSWNDFQRPLDG